MQNPSHGMRMLPVLLGTLLTFSELTFASSAPACTPPKEGSEELKACVQFSCQARQMCEKAKNKVKDKSNADAQGVGQKYAGSDQISSPGQDMSDLAKRSGADQGQAAGYCQGLAGSGGKGGGAGKTCQSMCDSSKVSEKEKDQMDQERQKCISQLNQIASGLKGAEEQNKQTAEEAKKSGEESKDQGGQSGGGDQKGDGGKGGGESPKSGEQAKPQEPQSKSPLEANCEGAQAAGNAACTSKLESECRGQFDSSPKCQAFSSRYCGTGFSPASASEGTLKPASGVSSDFCQQRTASTFCKSPGRSGCPSCNGMGANITTLSGSRLAEVCGSCASGANLDPIFANPSVANACRSALSSGGGGSGISTFSSGGDESIIGSPRSAAGGGGSGGGSGAVASSGGGEARLDPLGAKRESGDRLKTDVGGGNEGGGGGGYSYGGSSNENLSAPGSAADSRAPASDVSRGGAMKISSEVMNASGPNVFSIQSTVLRNRCEAGKFLHCEKSK